MILSILRKLFSSPIKVYKSEILILAVFVLLTIPGIINSIWFSNFYKEELMNDFESRSANTHQTIVMLYMNEKKIFDNKIINLIRYKDLVNSYIFLNDSMLFVLHMGSKNLNKQTLDSMWRMGLEIENARYVKRTNLFEKKSEISIFTVFDLSNLKNELKLYNNQLWIRAGLIFLIFIVLFIFVVYSLIKPIRKLSEEIKLILEGDTQAKLSSSYSFSEINIIANNINQLIENSESNKKEVIEEIQGLVDYLASRNEELEYAKNNAENANKYKTEFLANISHEIRTPLNAILGFAEQLLNSEKDESRRYYLKVIKNSGLTLISLVNDILDISKIESGRIEINKKPTNFPSLLQEISDLYSNKALSKGLTLIIEHDPNMPVSIIIDDLRMRQILINLISNAIKFTEKGSITLTTKLLKFNPIDGRINISISVKDTGIGISKEYKSLIFEPFTQQEGQSFRKYGGTGLGLPITKRLVELMGGRIEVQSEEGVGSEFLIYLNDIELVNKYDLLVEDDSVYFEFELAKILVFDVNDDDRELLVNSIQNKKLLLLQANNFDDFQKYCNYEQLNLIIYCCLGNNYNQDELVYNILELAHKKNIPIIGISNDISDKNDWHNNNKFAAIIQKPVHTQLLLNKIGKILNPSERNDFEKEIVDEFSNLWNTFIESANPIIIQKIREDFSDRAKELSNKLVLSQIKEFAEDFNKLSKKFNDKLLNEVFETLQENILKFQLNSVKKILILISKI